MAASTNSSCAPHGPPKAKTAEPRDPLQVGDGQFYDRQLGELIDPRSESAAVLADVKRRLGSYVSRAFRAQTGDTSARVVERLRADLARGRIETTNESVECIAEAVGFEGAENMRRAFIRMYGRSPQSIRRAIRN